MFEIRASDRPLTVRPVRTLVACAATALAQCTLIGVLIFIGHSVATDPQQPSHDERVVSVVFLPDRSGPGGGGGGGGNEMTTPPRKAEIPTPRQPTPTPVSEAVARPETLPQFNIPVTTLSSIEIPGTLTGPDPLPTASQGPGRGRGGGDGDGTGIGQGDGPGLGPGSGGNIGGGPLVPGTGGTDPVPVFRAAPEYTSQAVTARVSGEVWVECTVLPDGACVKARVIRSLDARFGLDQEALKAAERWRFRPGRDKSGRPVPFLVAIAVEFKLH